MTASYSMWWKSLPLRSWHEIMGLIHDWQARHAEHTEAGLPLSSPKASSEDEHQMIEEASDNEPKPVPAPALVASFTMALAHFDTVMVEDEQPEQQEELLVSSLWILQEEKCYSLELLEQHLLAEG